MPENYPEAVTGPYAIPTMAEVADAPQAFKDFADSIPIGGNIRVVDAGSAAFNITQAHSGALISCKVPETSITFDPGLTDGFNCAIVSTAGNVFVDPEETYQGVSQVRQYTMGSIVKIAGDVIVSTPTDVSEYTSGLTVSVHDAATYVVDRELEKNGVLLINKYNGADWTIEAGYALGSIINICNASAIAMQILVDPVESVRFFWANQLVETDGTYTKVILEANSTMTLLRVPKEGSIATDFSLSAITSVVSVA